MQKLAFSDEAELTEDEYIIKEALGSAMLGRIRAFASIKGSIYLGR